MLSDMGANLTLSRYAQMGGYLLEDEYQKCSNFTPFSGNVAILPHDLNRKNVCYENNIKQFTFVDIYRENKNAKG